MAIIGKAVAGAETKSYPAGSLFTVLGILACCITDGIMTLELMARGASELNPLMGYFIGLGLTPFLLGKYLITALCVMPLLVLRHRRLFNGHILASDLLPLVQLLYVALLIYQTYLLSVSAFGPPI